MDVKCDYCGAMVDERSKSCPKCGAPLSGANRTASEQPKTIEELKDWYVAHNLPPEEITRFFICKNIQEPKAFGIYKNEVGDCVVYKNKASGERAIRYQGADEAYAVNELYQRLRAEIVDQKAHNPKKEDKSKKNTDSDKKPTGDAADESSEAADSEPEDAGDISIDDEIAEYLGEGQPRRKGKRKRR